MERCALCYWYCTYRVLLRIGEVPPEVIFGIEDKIGKLEERMGRIVEVVASLYS